MIVPVIVAFMLVVPANRNSKISTATVIDPNAVAAVVPRIALSARGATDLANEFGATTDFRGAIIAPAIVGGTIDCFLVALVFSSIVPYFVSFGTRRQCGSEIRTTATIRPNCVTNEVPGVASCTRRPTALPKEVDSATSVDLTVMALAVVRRAVNAVVQIKGNVG